MSAAGSMSELIGRARLGRVQARSLPKQPGSVGCHQQGQKGELSWNHAHREFSSCRSRQCTDLLASEVWWCGCSFGECLTRTAPPVALLLGSDIAMTKAILGVLGSIPRPGICPRNRVISRPARLSIVGTRADTVQGEPSLPPLGGLCSSLST